LNVQAVRQQVLREIAIVTDMAEAMLYTAPSLGLPPKRYRDRDGRWRTDASGGEWDWFWPLHEEERTRLVRWGRCACGGCQPDEIQFYWGAGLGYDDVDSTMWAWLGYTRTGDAGRVLLHGNLPRPDAYGGLDANDLFPDTGHDLNQLFGRDARQYLADWVDPEELAAS
jgi:hypothetical protein